MTPLKLSFSAKIFLGFVLLLLTFASASLLNIYQLRQIGSHLKMLNRYQHLTALATRLRALKLNQKTALHQLSNTKPTDWQSEVFQRLEFPHIIQRSLKRSLQNLQNLPAHIPAEDRLFLSRTRKHIEKLLRLLQHYQKRLTSLVQHRNAPTARSTYFTAFQKTERALGKEIRLLTLQLDFRLIQTVFLAEREERRAVWWLLLTSILALIVGIVILLLSLIPLNRIKQLVGLAQRIGAGEYLQKANIPLGDEIGVLAQAFNNMALSLHERDQTLVKQRDELEQAYQDLRKSSEQLLRSERLATIGRLAAQVTHEIRNPLNAIGLNLELLEEDIGKLSDPQESLAILSAAMEQVEHLTSLTEEYLRFARLPPPQLEPANINQLLSDTMHFLREEFSTQDVQWDLELDESVPSVNIDMRQLRQAILNLLRNASEAATSVSSREARIHVCTEHVQHPHDEGVTIHIHDNGAGIPLETQEKIFDPFFSTKEEGSGLGLPLTQQIITGHGGEISCKSAPNQGTTFSIFLPKDT